MVAQSKQAQSSEALGFTGGYHRYLREVVGIGRNLDTFMIQTMQFPVWGYLFIFGLFFAKWLENLTNLSGIQIAVLKKIAVLKNQIFVGYWDPNSGQFP